MAEPATCPRCGRPLPADAAEGLCPACLLEAALNLPPAPGNRAAATRPPLRRKRLLHYQLLEKIGEGGMGVVYKARDTRLDRLVAIKVLPADKVSDAERRRRFVHEAKAASALNHPNIVTIHEVAASGGVHFIVMEFVEGRTLDQLVGTHGLPVEQVLLYAVPIAGALARAHEAGIVHRDLKPQNIMVRDDGLVKLLDFGLAKLVEVEGGPAVTHVPEFAQHPSPLRGPLPSKGTPRSGSPLETGGLEGRGVSPLTDAAPSQGPALHTEPSRIMGTPGFMAPEQIEGRKVDGHADIFAFGAVLYHALSGRKPFGRSTVDDTFTAILRDEPAPLENVPVPLAEIVARCLRKNPHDRFATAAEMQTALRAVRSGSIADRPEPSVAVLPFANDGGDPEDNYFGDALSGEIITALAKLPGLKVIGRTSSLVVAAAQLESRAIGERLGVAHLLEGGVQRSDTELHVVVRLIKAADGSCVWAEAYNRKPADVFAIQDDIAGTVGQRLGVRTRARGGHDGPPTDNLESYHHYLLGRHAFDRFDLAMSRVQFERATQLDPEFAAAYDGLAETWWWLGFVGVVPPREAFGLGLWAALRAVEIDGQCADTIALVAMFRKELDYNWAEVRRGFERARALDPNDLKVRLRYSISGLMPAGRLEEACAECEEILRVDPLACSARHWYATLLNMRGEFNAAAEQCRIIIAQEPRFTWSYLQMAVSQVCLGNGCEALASIREYVQRDNRSSLSLGFLGWACSREGLVGEARAILGELEQRARSGYVPPSAAAFVCIGLGELDRAAEQIDRAIGARDPMVIPLKYWPPFDPIRTHPRYPELLRKMNMEP